MTSLPYVFRWARHGRKGERCAVTARSRAGTASFALAGFGRPAVARFNSIRVEFADSYAMVTSGNAICKAKP
ncbi:MULTISPECIES: hypothetical protein [unclassified Mesorhizobium]|uniref:hypothetical protein n=1 Tax=unclassified Mesorhizobium TaxID=325217 RepID=UPI00112B5C2D|nr:MULTISPECIES: hypothetical protein [unclassified Mesorhizobium]MCA0027386.1 hypothetical protein [Mesorhizobium sp. B263B1A]TPJ98656.1 hypothetical protein FJ489_06945 [Mesorhizobium sp. B2-5-12]TPK28819.1 hypothetical protein FJ562_00335 [Mesorhizobium sp. B2-5-6]